MKIQISIKADHRIRQTESRQDLRHQPFRRCARRLWMTLPLFFLMVTILQAASIDRVQLQRATGSIQVQRGSQALVASRSMELRTGDDLSTGGNGRMVIDLGADNFLELGPNGQLNITQISKEKDGSMSVRLKLTSGTLYSHVQELASREGLMEVQTSVAKITIPGAVARFTVESADVVRVEVDDGLVMIPRQGKTTTVEAGHGVSLKRSSPAAEPIKLPESPKPISPPEGQVGTAQSIHFSWQSPNSSSSTRFIVSLDPHLRESVFSTVVKDPQGLSLDSLAPGKYYWSVSTITPQGMESTPSRPRPFSLIDKLIVLPTRLHDGLVFLPPDGCLKFTWDGPPKTHYRFRLSEDALFTHPLVDVNNLVEPNYQTRLANSGDYFWQVQAVEYPITSPLARITVKTSEEFEAMFRPANSVWSTRTNYIDKLVVVDPAGDGKLTIVGVDVWSNLYAIDAATGALRWKVQNEGEKSSVRRYTNYTAPLVVNHEKVGSPRVIFANGRDQVLCVNAPDGVVLWKFQTAAQIHTTPTALALHPGEAPLVFVVDDANTVYGLNAADGAVVLKQKLTLLGKMNHAPTLGLVGGTPQFIVASDGGNVGNYSLDGDALWKINLDSPISTRPLVTETDSGAGVVIAGTLDGHVVALSFSSGTRLWQYPEGASDFQEIAQPVVAHILPESSHLQLVFGTKRGSESKLHEGAVVMLDVTNGKLIWEHPMPTGVYGSFVSADLDLDGTPDLIGETGGVVNTTFALSGRTGAELFEVTNKSFLEKANAVTSVIVQANSYREYPTVPSEASPTPLIHDLNGDGLLELVFLDHDFTGLSLYRTISPASALAPQSGRFVRTLENGTFQMSASRSTEVAIQK
jgi:outer membrane protein assembly factor BamB